MKKENRNMKKNRQILVLAALLFSFLCFPADKVLAASNVVEVPFRSRNQLVLDLANPEVREYLIEALSKILKKIAMKKELILLELMNFVH